MTEPAAAPASPPAVTAAVVPDAVEAPPIDRDLQLQGHYAGIVTRFGSFLIDVIIITGAYALGGQVLDYVVSRLGGSDSVLSDHPLVAGAALLAWAFVYSAYPLAVAGRTPGMAVLGLKAVRRDGRELDGRHAIIRVLAFPLSFLLFGFGFVLILLNRDRRALHDLIGRTAVVYAWDARAARLRFLARGPTSPPAR